MKQYLDALNYVISNGTKVSNRTGIDTISTFGYQMRFDLQDGFPLVTTKKMHFKGIIHELLWFLNGDTNAKTLQKNGVHIWDEWATEEQCAKFRRVEGDLGPIYGHNWRNFGASSKNTQILNKFGWNKTYNNDGVDQISYIINEIKKNPTSRRLIVSAWNPKEINEIALPACHTMFQFNVINNKLSCQLYQRSADLPLGVPYNIASYALLTHMIAQICNLEVGDYIHTIGDMHIYENQLDGIHEQLTREPLELPKIYLNPKVQNIFDFVYDDIKLIDYQSHTAIKMPVAI
jgi:thymidylate synthase